MGYRPRLHDASLPGSPDLVFPRLRKVVFVHGCFWHRHRAARCPRKLSTPASGQAYWLPKLARNEARDRRAARALRRPGPRPRNSRNPRNPRKVRGWGVAVVWECELRDPARLKRRLERFLRDVRARRQADLSSNPPPG